MKHPDVGFGMTVQDANAKDLVELYRLSNEMNMEFATASLHNSFYFVEAKNIIKDRPMVAKEFESLINELLKSNSPKKWFRAYFNHGLINYIYGQKDYSRAIWHLIHFLLTHTVMLCLVTEQKKKKLWAILTKQIGILFGAVSRQIK